MAPMTLREAWAGESIRHTLASDNMGYLWLMYLR
jgi:hypothetical protein